VEFAAKEAATKQLMAAERRAARELEEITAYNAGCLAWQAHWRWRREEVEAGTAAKRVGEASASGGAGH
jgi:hypothetical protein